MTLWYPRLVGFGGHTPAAASGGADVTVTYLGSSVFASDAGAFTSSSHSLSTAASGRQIVVAASLNDESPNDISSVTVAGNSASLIVRAKSSFYSCELWYVTVATGTTGDIVVTPGGSMNNCGLAAWAVYNASATISDSDSSNGSGTSGTATITVPAGGAGIAAVRASGGVTHTWSGLTNEDYDETVEGNERHSGASEAFSTLQSGLGVTATFSASTAYRLTACAFAKA